MHFALCLAMNIAFVAPIQESLPFPWFFRESFSARAIIIFIWLLMASVLALAYESNLLAILATIRYEKAIETAEDLWNSDAVIALPTGNVLEVLFKTSPNPYVQKLYNNKLITYEAIRKEY